MNVEKLMEPEFLTARKFGCERWPLHYAVRLGNMEEVRYLVEVEKKSVNEQDRHDATPLYLAALTGNVEICLYLLENGAKCDPESGGDAARVFYVALTPELRKILKEWNLSAASRDPFLDILRKTFQDSTYADCFVSVPSSVGYQDKIYLHYVILFARCPQLVHLFQDIEENSQVTELRLPPSYRDCNSAVFGFMKYLYTGKFETRDVETALIVQDMAKYFSLKSLYEELSHSLSQHLLDKSKGRLKLQIIQTEALKSEMMDIAMNISIPLEESDSKKSLKLVQWSDSTIRCHDKTWSIHKFIFCQQSEYFKCALSGGFREAQEAFIELSHLVPSTEAVKYAIQWIYCHCFLDEPNLETAVVLLELGSAILCPRLSAHAANTVLIPAVNAENVFRMLDLAQAYNLTKLEDRCIDIFALNLDELARTHEFKEMITREVTNIEQKGDVLVTDVPIVAEIRSSILRLLAGDVDREEQIRRLKLLRKILLDSIESIC